MSFNKTLGIAFIAAVLLASGAWAQATKNYTATMSCNDVEDGDLSGSIEWTSSIQAGVLGIGSPATLALIQGTHTVTATCTDSGGLSSSASVTQVVSINEPPVVGTPQLQEEVAVGFLGVTPDAAITGLWGLELRPKPDGTAAYLEKPEGGSESQPVADWGDKIVASVSIDTAAAVIANGAEFVVMRGADASDTILWDLFLVGTPTGVSASGRVYETGNALTMPQVVLPTPTHRLGIEWHQNANLGLIRLYLDDVLQSEIIDLNTDNEMSFLRLGAPETTAGLIGLLAFDDVEVKQGS